MGVSRVWYGQPRALDAHGAWVARAVYADDRDGRPMPIGVEVRPAGLTDEAWSPLPQQVDQSQLPDSGLSLGVLRSGLNWDEQRTNLEQVVDLDLGDALLGELYDLGAAALLQH